MDPITILTAIAPQFAPLTNLAVHQELAAAQTDLTYFGQNYNLAVALRMAHELTLQATATSGRGGAGGAITSEREGDLARSYAPPAGYNATSALGQTSYGLRLLGLIRTSNLGVTNRRMLS